MRVAVWVDSWQFQCCGDDFAVGDPVSWRLRGGSGAWLGDLLGDQAPPAVGVLPVLEHLAGDGTLGAGTVAGDGGLRVSLPDQVHRFAGAQTEPEPWIGLLSEDHHIGVPREAPPTEGLVRRIRLTRFAYHFDPAKEGHVPTPGSATLLDVDPAHKWPEDEIAGRRFAGYLVDLDVQAGGIQGRTDLDERSAG